MIEFEVMIRPLKALEALAGEMGNRIGPELAQMKQAAGAPRAHFGRPGSPATPPRVLAPAGSLWQEPPACRGL